MMDDSDMMSVNSAPERQVMITSDRHCCFNRGDINFRSNTFVLVLFYIVVLPCRLLVSVLMISRNDPTKSKQTDEKLAYFIWGWGLVLFFYKVSYVGALQQMCCWVYTDIVCCLFFFYMGMSSHPLVAGIRNAISVTVPVGHYPVFDITTKRKDVGFFLLGVTLYHFNEMTEIHRRPENFYLLDSSFFDFCKPTEMSVMWVFVFWFYIALSSFVSSACTVHIERDAR